MKYKLLIVLLLFSFNSVFGQTQESKFAKDTQAYTLSKRFFDNWDVGVAGGINLYFGEEDHLGNLAKLLLPSAEISLTKMATPIISFRFMGTVGVVNGWYNSATPSHSFDGRWHYESFNMITAQGHVMFNISNAIWGYNPKRRFSIIPFLGVGAASPWGNGRHNRELLFPIGLLNKVRLSDKFDFTVELRHFFVNPRMNYVTKSGRWYEGMGTISIGVSYKLGNKRLKSNNVASDQRISHITNRDLVSGNQQSIQKINNAEVSVLTSSIRDTTIMRDTVYVTPPLLIFFPINKSSLDDNELVKLDQYMRFVLKATPNKEFKLISLSGHADKATGNASINQRLSEQRVETIRRILIEKYKIQQERIAIKAEGDTNNPFEEASPNRLVILR